MIVCPYCKQEMKALPDLPPMRPRWQRIYSALLETGPKGMTPEDLQICMYARDELPTKGGPTVLRVAICDMNKKLRRSGQKIINWHHGCYRLISIEELEHEKAQEKV